MFIDFNSFYGLIFKDNPFKKNKLLVSTRCSIESDISNSVDLIFAISKHS